MFISVTSTERDFQKLKRLGLDSALAVAGGGCVSSLVWTPSLRHAKKDLPDFFGLKALTHLLSWAGFLRLKKACCTETSLATKTLKDDTTGQVRKLFLFICLISFVAILHNPLFSL